MSGVLSFPFRVGQNAEIATVPAGSDLEVEQAIAVLVLTRLGERPMEPLFGTIDPIMAELEPGEIQIGLDTFGPEGIIIQSVETVPLNGSDTVSKATVLWSRDEDEGEVI